jgi:hypothetical protein
MSAQVSITITPIDCGDIALVNFKSSKVFPVAKYRSVTDKRWLVGIASRIVVFLFWVLAECSFMGRCQRFGVPLSIFRANHRGNLKSHISYDKNSSCLIVEYRFITNIACKVRSEV